MIAAAFYAIATLAFLCALTLVFHRNPMVAAIAMAGAMLCVGALYLLLHVPFLAFFQVIVYAGAVMVIVLFVIMALGQEELGQPVSTPQTLFTYAASLLFIWQVSKSLRASAPGVFVPAGPAFGNIKEFGHLLASRYAVPFELATLLLLGAMVGSVVLSRKRWE